MSRAEDDTDDEGLEGLGSFRAMFREIPDEEPPQRGLAELMAAARVKAEEMAKPSLWERFLQTMRRPQVMALATIMILIGGAVFISQRKSEMDASPTASQPAISLEEKEAAPAGQTVVTGAAGSSMAYGSATAEDKKSDGEVADQGVAAPADSKADERQRATDMVAKGTGSVKAEAKSDAPSTAPARKAVTKAPPKTVSPSKPRPADSKTSSGDMMLEGGLDDDRPAMGASPGAGAAGGGTKSAAAPTPPTESAPEPEKPIAPTTTATSPNKQQSLTVQQLHANARKLATAGDCAQVRTIAKQIAAKDAKYYRDNIAPDSTLASCLK